MNKFLLFFCVSFLLCVPSFAQNPKTKNIIIITLDGYRWKELFNGADPAILNNNKYVKDPAAVAQFGAPSPEIRREKLMPFFWNVIGRHGQLYGNRKYKNEVNCSNMHLLSYPGYSEMLVGFPERSIVGNREIENPNSTVLEFIHKDDNFKNHVAAFATWHTFSNILRKDKVDFHINAGMQLAEGSISDREKWMNENQELKFGSRSDAFTFQYAFEFLKRERPRVMFLGFDETDSNAHAGQYGEYLKAANNIDKMIAELWSWIQSQPDYKDQTTLFITTDHGRGNGKNIWKNHRLLATGSRHIWFAVMGPDTPGFGEMKFAGKYFQKQVAKTVAAFLGLQYQQNQRVGDVVQTMLAVSPLVPDNSIPTAEASSSKEKE